MNLSHIRLQEEEKEEKQRRLISALGTLLILAIVAVLLIFFGFKYLDPPPPEEGVVMVSMGREEGGFTQETPQQTKAEEAASSPETEESFETQDYEDAPQETSNPTPTNPNTTPPNDSKKKDKPTKKVNSDYLFESGDKNTNNGDDNTDGNKGKEDGLGIDPNGGYGLGDDGSGWFMNGRKPETRISASCKFTRNATVVVVLKVNRSGNVVSTECRMKFQKFNATTIEKKYCDCAKNAAKTVRFTPKSDAPATQTGAVKFVFKVK
jgi:hypothetical protein